MIGPIIVGSLGHASRLDWVFAHGACINPHQLWAADSPLKHGATLSARPASDAHPESWLWSNFFYMALSLPRYRQIKRYLLKRIQNGELAAHHKIAPEEQIARDFGVSRMTANKAVRDLAADGYLVRHPGLGTFVTDRKAESSLLAIRNIADEVRQRGHGYRNDVIKCEAIAADDEVALRLGVRLGANVFHTIFVHREDGVPIQLENRYVNPRWVPGYLSTDFTEHTPNEVLVAACPISDREHIVEAVDADAYTATLLEIKAGTACLCLARRTWSEGHLISYARLSHPGDRYKLRSFDELPFR